MRCGCTVTRREVADRRDVENHLVLDMQKKVARILHTRILIGHDNAEAGSG